MKSTVLTVIGILATVFGLSLGPYPPSAAAAELAPGVELLSTIGSKPTRVAVAGQYAYMTQRDAGLQIIDLSDLSYPRQRGNLPLEIDEPYMLSVSGNQVYICDYAALRIIDVSQPDQPRALWHSDGPCMDVEVVGNLAYVVAGQTGLSSFDVSNPLSPQVVGTAQTPQGRPMAKLAISDEQLFILGNHGD